MLLRGVANGIVPVEILRAPRGGFAIPGRKWWRGGLGRALSELLPESMVADEGWLSKPAVENALREHRSGEADHSTRLFLVLVLELWLRLQRGRWSRNQPLSILLGGSPDVRPGGSRR